MALPFTFKSILMQKKNYENSNISPCKNIIFQKSSKRNQNPSRYYDSITNLKFQHKPKYHLSKTLVSKLDLLPRGQHPLTVIPYNESKHNILALVGENNKGRIMSILLTSILHKRILLLPFCGGEGSKLAI